MAGERNSETARVLSNPEFAPKLEKYQRTLRRGGETNGREPAYEPKGAPLFQEKWDAFQNGSYSEPRNVYDVEEVFQKWMYLPDAGIVHVTLGTIAANLLPQSPPTWLMTIGAPGGGKTETIRACSDLPGIHFAATLTEAALLSGSAKKDRTADATGGLLRQIGDFGFLICKDFTSVLSMNRDVRASTLAALREVYDGQWTRCVGTDGGRTLSWTGKVGFIGCVTPILDQHHAVLSAMGERFVYYRLPASDPEQQALRAIENAGRSVEMARDLADAVSSLFRTVKVARIGRPNEAERSRFVSLATLAAQARSAVERDGRTREVDLVPESEMPARLAQALLALDEGMRIIGTEREERWRLICKVAFDSLPALRRRVLFAAVRCEVPRTTSDFALMAGHPTPTVRRALEDLVAHGVLRRQKLGNGQTDLWEATEKTRERWAAAEVTLPEMSGAQNETFPEMSGDD